MSSAFKGIDASLWCVTFERFHLLHCFHMLGLLYNRLLHVDPPSYLNPFQFRLCFVFGQFLHTFSITFNGSVTKQSYLKRETVQAAT